MKRTILSILLMICLFAGLAQPVLATEPADAAQETASPQTAEPSARTIPAGQTYTVSAEGVAFINEMMSGSYGGSSQLAGAESSVNAFITKYSLALTQYQFDALVDLVMAYGGTILTSGYRCEKLISAGGYTDAELASAFCAWVKSASGFSEQLLARRLRELKLFLYNSYSGNCPAGFRYLVFHANGGTLDDNTVLCYAIDSAYGTLPTASRDGKVFAGWFTAATGGTQVLEADVVTQNQTVYAQWKDPQTPTEATAAPTEATEATEPEPEEEPVSFVDVPESAWFYAPVTKAASLKLFQGMSATEFMPDEPTTRAMIVTVLHRLNGSPASTATAPFTDMVAGSWYIAPLNWAYEKQIVDGITATYFGVDENVTREQLTTMLFRYANAMGLDTSARKELSAFSDASRVMDYAKDAMRWAVATGIVNGDNGRLYPQNNATRAECAKMIVVFRDWLATANAAPSEPSEPSTPTVDPSIKPALPTLKTSEAGIQFIKDHEGFLKYAVWDYSQYSIGYGTRCEKDEFPNGITEEEADYRLRVMLASFEKTVDALLAKSSISHTQAQYDAIISFTFNLGQQWMYSNYTVYQYIMNGGYTELQFVNTMGAWINAGGEALDGLAKRRIDEANLYLNGEYALGSRKYQRVVFYTNGGNFGTKSDSTPITSDYFYYKSADPFGWLPSAPTREGYRFLGWFDKPSGGTQFTESSYPSTAVSKLFAHWEELPPETTAEPAPTEPTEPGSTTEATNVTEATGVTDATDVTDAAGVTDATSTADAP